MSRTVPPPAEDMLYPASDGKPLGETGWHVDAIYFLLAAFKERCAGVLDVFFASNMFLYFEAGKPKSNQAPDFVVVKGVPSHQRRIFKTWEEGAVPCLIVEITSKDTRREDRVEKLRLYERLGVAEYFLFDPLGEHLQPRFQGHRLEAGAYLRLAPDPEGGLVSEETGVRLVPRGEALRVFDARTNRPSLTAEEKADLLLRETQAKDRERRRADREARRARKEAGRADALAAEVERLRAMLDRRGGEA